MPKKLFPPVLRVLAISASLVLTLVLLICMLQVSPVSTALGQESAHLGLSDKFGRFVKNELSDALDGVVYIPKEYWLSDEDIVAPEPDPDCFGYTNDPASLDWLIEDAQELLDGQELIFNTGISIPQDSQIKYYLDKTILAITWKQVVGTATYTFSEVKIQHPSQFRRFLSGGEYGSGVLYTATEMAASVNAVTASSADYYAYRPFGNTVYNGSVKRSGDTLLDTCYVDDQGDLRFTLKGELFRKEDIESYIRDNNIRFSLAFGPLMILDGEVLAKSYYSIGEVDQRYSRAALCQQGPLHYLVVAANSGGSSIVTFANNLHEMGIVTAYALDGGQTAFIVTGDELMNCVDYGGERKISDIIYFATAIPDGG